MTNESIATILIDDAIHAMSMAKAPLSGVKVGASLYAKNPSGLSGVFRGCNIEVSAGAQCNIHAERLALLKAVSEGYLIPEVCVLTTHSPLHSVAMCGYCMQDFTYFNPECKIIVAEVSTKRVLLETTVRERQGQYGYFGTSKIKLEIPIQEQK